MTTTTTTNSLLVYLVKGIMYILNFLWLTISVGPLLFLDNFWTVERQPIFCGCKIGNRSFAPIFLVRAGSSRISENLTAVEQRARPRLMVLDLQKALT